MVRATEAPFKRFVIKNTETRLHVDGVAVFPAGARLKHQRQLTELLHKLLVRHPRRERLSVMSSAILVGVTT